MLKLAHWSTTHRKYVLLGWIVLLLVVNALAQSAGTTYSNNFTLPNSDAQRAADLLQRSFPAQAGDRDTIVYAVSTGTVLDPAVRARMERDVRAKSAQLPHVTAVISPYAGASARQGDLRQRQDRVRDRGVRRESQPPAQERRRTRRRGRSRRRRGRAFRSSSAGRRSRRPSRWASDCPPRSGLLAAIVVLLLTFGSLIAMGLPIVTALFGLGTGLGAIALFTHVVDTPNFSSELAAMIGLGVGIDYALFILTRFREAYAHARADVRRRARVGRAGDGHRRARRAVRRLHRRDRAAGDDAARRQLPLRGGDLRLDRRAAGDARLADAAAGAADVRGRRVARPSRRARARAPRRRAGSAGLRRRSGADVARRGCGRRAGRSCGTGQCADGGGPGRRRLAALERVRAAPAVDDRDRRNAGDAR